MKKSFENPFEYINSDTNLDNELVYKQILGLGALKRNTDFLARVAQNATIDADYETRDFFLTGTYPSEKTNLFQYARQHYDSLKTIDSSNKFKSLMKECLLKKYNFWNENSSIYPDTKEKAESKRIIQRQIYLHKIPSFATFSIFGLVLGYLLGLYKNSYRNQGVVAVTGIALGYVYGEFKYAGIIFDAIPPLPDPETEKKRLDVFNYCFSIDINLIAQELA